MQGYERERQAVREAVHMLLNAGFAVRPVLAEQFPADPEPPRQALFKELDSSDIYVGIFGRRYGYVNPQSGLSATEEEYQRARERAKQILALRVSEWVKISPYGGNYPLLELRQHTGEYLQA
ncbi:MAG: DUF4062 domain-containing protein [Deinococcus sp.]|nr:DUF4062 domain-containing protein [Deinococcus sp.]